MLTEALFLMGAGTLFFLVIMGYLNLVMKAGWGWTYCDHPRPFFWLFIVANLGILVLMREQFADHLTLQAVVLIIVSGALFLRFSLWWQQQPVPADCRAYFGIPLHHEDMLQMNAGYAVVKALEIVFQQLCALVVIDGLFRLESSALVVSLLFASVVGLAHLPGVRWFGRLFGGFFTASSFGLALVYPLIIVSERGGVGVMVLLHVLTYVCWYLYLFGRLPVPAHEKARE
jgi:hypothetical protein